MGISLLITGLKNKNSEVKYVSSLTKMYIYLQCINIHITNESLIKIPVEIYYLRCSVLYYSKISSPLPMFTL